MVERGDIIIINFDPVKGYEQAGKRPALVISNEKFYKIFKLAVILPITNNTKDLLEEVLWKSKFNFSIWNFKFPYDFLMNIMKLIFHNFISNLLNKIIKCTKLVTYNLKYKKKFEISKKIC